jgi:hypothetical protein
MVLTYDAYAETIEEKEQKKSEVKELNDKYEQVESHTSRDKRRIILGHRNLQRLLKLFYSMS